MNVTFGLLEDFQPPGSTGQQWLVGSGRAGSENLAGLLAGEELELQIFEGIFHETNHPAMGYPNEGNSMGNSQIIHVT